MKEQKNRKKNQKKNVLVITGGPLDTEFGLRYYQSRSWDAIIAADRGIAFCRRADILPDEILGDFDSADTDDYDWFYKKVPERFTKYPSRKDDTDTELAIFRALAVSEAEISIIGALGGRVDHLLGNIQLLKKAADAGRTCYLLDEKNRIRMTASGLTLRKDELYAPNVSLIPFTPVVKGLTLRGFSYEVTDFDLLSGYSRGVSNALAADKGTIAFTEGLLLVVESAD